MSYSHEVLAKISKIQKRNFYFYSNLLPLIDKSDNRSELLDKIVTLYDELFKLNEFVSSFDSHCWWGKLTAVKPYNQWHVTRLTDFLMQNQLLEDLLRCKNIPAVLEMSSLLFHEGLTKNIESFIKNETDIKIVLDAIQRDNTNNQRKQKNINWLLIGSRGQNYQQYAVPNVGYHQLLIDNRDIAGEIDAAVTICKISCADVAKLVHVVHVIRSLKADNTWEQVLSEMKNENSDFLKLVSNHASLVPIAFDLGNQIKPDESTKKTLNK
jgi:hypothetical protein